jgi:ATP-dependent DNA ligase
VKLGTPPMEAKLVTDLPAGDGWQFEPKWDGFRCLAFRAGPQVELQSKSGKSLTRYFPEVAAMLRTLALDRFVVDGELAILKGGALSFDALQDRLHPADSRVRRLAAETPAMFILFDCLATADDGNLTTAPMTARRTALERFFASVGHQPELRITPYTRDIATARGWLKKAQGSLDGIVAKPLNGPYEPGERAMMKVKLLRTADCVVGGFRYESDSNLVGSLLLGLHDAAGFLHHVGFTSTIKDSERNALTKRLEALVAHPGFTGEAPGGPSRWSTERSADWHPLKPKLVVEVKYDQVTGDRFRHGTRLLRWRPDKKPSQCTCDQLQREAPPTTLLSTIIRR